MSGLSGKGTVGGGLVFAGLRHHERKVRRLQGPRRQEQGRRSSSGRPRGPGPRRTRCSPTRKSASTRRWSTKIKLAAKNGAAAVVFVNDRDMAGKDDPLMPFDYASDDGQIGDRSRSCTPSAR